MTRKRTNLRDIAKATGVHTSTVSRAMDVRTRHLITEDVVRKVLKAADKLNYRQNRLAGSLRNKRTRSIGIIIPDITNMLFPPIIKGIEKRLAESDYVAMIGNSDGIAIRESVLMEGFLAHGVEGLIIATAHLPDAEIVRVAREGTAIVTMNRRVRGRVISSVGNDEKAGIGAVLKHLTGLGHRNIAYISGPRTSTAARMRLSAYRDFAKNYGLPIDEAHIARANSFLESEGERCANDLLARGEPLTAIVCSSDILAIGVLAALRKHGISCPNEISVTGYNDIPFVDRLSPALTTVRVPYFDAGSAAADMLLAEVHNPGKLGSAKYTIMPVSLVVRESTGPVPAQKAKATSRLS